VSAWLFFGQQCTSLILIFNYRMFMCKYTKVKIYETQVLPLFLYIRPQTRISDTKKTQSSNKQHNYLCWNTLIVWSN
jgi:hypothetical protein